ncbi:Putative bud22/Serum response factor-binding protein [Septoria linicola]|uniref:Bud22/Serum response factor-binding protein n=1 Tax=Septoria linicola TaxID=215465 RepID=A0A9Q9EDX0_9PEZI|nr:putative bud22/Serum response factor-binding protein [Septoria linicola]USW48166.1 Putative bud22/Serum response factor-binding protein [Septoria linicola]
MSKRKREAEDNDAVDGEDGSSRAAPNFRRQRQVTAAFAQSAQKLEQALKLARGFERQKLGRRKKTAAAAANGGTRTRIDAEVAALKSLDMAQCAQNVLAKALVKEKAVATAPDLPTSIRAPPAVSSEPAALNVYARLRNSNPVKAVLPAAAAAVKLELGIGDDHAKVQKGKPSSKRDRRVPGSSEDDDAESHREDDESDEEDSIGGGSDVDVEDLERMLEEEGMARKSARRRLEDESVPSDSESDVASRATKKPSKAVPKKLFLPTLTMAGYISGSGSDVDDVGEDDKPKKNRRGQRARQAIWEKKFGKKAKHVQEQEHDAKQGWDAKRGAVGGSKFAKDANRLPLGKQRAIFSSTKDPAATKKPQRDDSGPLHPSWEAAKRAKEKKSVPVAFQGKKISFD